MSLRACFTPVRLREWPARQTDLAFAGARRRPELLRAGEVSPRELVETFLARIDRLDPQLNAFRRCFGERALSRPTRPPRA